MSKKPPKGTDAVKSHTFKNEDARNFWAQNLVEREGANAMQGIAPDGPLGKAVLAIMKERGIEPANPLQSAMDILKSIPIMTRPLPEDPPSNWVKVSPDDPSSFPPSGKWVLVHVRMAPKHFRAPPMIMAVGRKFEGSVWDVPGGSGVVISWCDCLPHDFQLPPKTTSAPSIRRTTTTIRTANVIPDQEEREVPQGHSLCHRIRLSVSVDKEPERGPRV